MSLRIRRGTDAERQGLTLDLGEIVWTTDTEQLWVGDGVTQGGVNPANSLAGTNLSFNEETNQLDVTNLTTDSVAEGSTNKYFASLLAQNAAASLFQTGTHTGITFTYDDSQHKINATVTVEGSGNFNLVNDTTPELGGDLGLNSNNITGAGNIDIIGNIEATGTIYAGGGLGVDLSLNGNNIIGTGNIQTTGTFWASTGLGGNLVLNNFDINGTGNVDITGDVNASTLLLSAGLGGTLYLNSNNIEGTGNINITGDITASGTISGNVDGTFTGELVGTVTNGLTTLVSGTAKILSNTRVSIVDDVVTSTSTNIELGDQTTSNTLIFNQVDARSSMIIKSVSTSFGNTSKVSFYGYGSSLTTPTTTSAGNYIGILSYGVYNSATSEIVPAGLISVKRSTDGGIDAVAADGTIEFVANATSGGPKYLTFNNQGRLAVNQETASSTLDVNGDARATLFLAGQQTSGSDFDHGYSFSGTEGGHDTGMFSAADGILKLVSNANTVVTVNPNKTITLAVLTAEPASPVNGTVAVADGTSWDPCAVGGLSYPVFYNGAAWIKMFS